MLVLYESECSKDDDFQLNITPKERERLVQFQHDRDISFDKYFKFNRNSGPSIVLDDFLFLGDFQNAKDEDLLDRFQIKHILNVSDLNTAENILKNFNVIHIPMADMPQTNIKQHFDKTNELLHGFYEKQERCLVHCAAGISRSATVVLAYLMKYHHNTLKEAFHFLIEKRPKICPNEGFMVQLMRYEDELIQSREITINQHFESENIQEEKNPIETLDAFEHKHEKDE